VVSDIGGVQNIADDLIVHGKNDEEHDRHLHRLTQRLGEKIGQVILRGTRIVIPKVSRQRVLELAHEGHLEVVKMKERLRSEVWWPGVNKNERPGVNLTKEALSPPMKTTRMPERPWQDLAT